MITREQIDLFCESNEVNLVMLESTFDPAILCLSENEDGYFLVYDSVKCVDILIEHDEMTRQDAVEYFDVNIGTAYIGIGTPRFTVDLER